MLAPISSDVTMKIPVEAAIADSHASPPKTFRPMTENDLDQVHALECASQHSPWSLDHFREELANPCSQIDLCWQGDRLAGFLCSWFIAGELQVQNVATSPAFRRQGVAARLLSMVLHRSLDAGLEAAWLEVRAGNTGAIALYERFGFHEVARRPGYYPDGEAALIMCFRPTDHKAGA